VKDLVPQSEMRDKDGLGKHRCVKVRAIDGPYRGAWFRFYRQPKGIDPFGGEFDSELALDSRGTLIVYDLIETPDPKKWILTYRRTL
jgi:hypothetical protein